MLIRVHSVQDIDIIATYSGTSGDIKIKRVKMKDLSASWVLENPIDKGHDKPKASSVTLTPTGSGVEFSMETIAAK